MGLNSTPDASRIHIGFFGRRNVGKSSLVNAVTGQELAVVSDVKGTTTDPVTKAMELLPLGPVVIIDTPGFDDEGKLGAKRVMKTKQILNKTDIAVLVVDGSGEMAECDKELIEIFKSKNIPYMVAVNKSDLCNRELTIDNALNVSAKTGYNIYELKEKISKLVPVCEVKPIVSDLIRKGSIAVLVTPIDESAPKGRMILPQQQVMRDLLDGGNIAVITKETELESALSSLKAPPEIVITDSQAFEYVSKAVPDDIKLTSFSILMARYKGFLDTSLKGADSIKALNDNDTVLIAEGCTHHRRCNDIGTVKIPRLLKEYTGKSINIKTCSGRTFPDDLSEFSLVIHCGGCMLTQRDVLYRMKCAADQGIPFTNYGVLIAKMQGILDRSIEIFDL